MPLLPIPFSNPYTYAGHSGVDFPQGRGTAFKASGPGRVTSIDYAPRPGHTVWVKYDNGPLVGYCHMDRRTTDVWLNRRVEEGTILGRVGSLGTASTGPHLHVEVSGYATTAGFWRFFDRNRVVGQGSGSGGGSVPFPPTPAPIIPKPEDKMYIARSIKDDIGDNVWPNGIYLVSANGVTSAAASNVSTINRLNLVAADKAPIDLYASELRDLDARLQAAKLPEKEWGRLMVQQENVAILDAIKAIKTGGDIDPKDLEKLAQLVAAQVTADLPDAPSATEVADAVATRFLGGLAPAV